MKLDLPKRTMMLYNFNNFFFTLLLSEGKKFKTKNPKKNNKGI